MNPLNDKLYAFEYVLIFHVLDLYLVVLPLANIFMTIKRTKLINLYRFLQKIIKIFRLPLRKKW